MCSNCVIFSGDPKAIENVKALFKEIEDQQEATGQWHLPPYVTADSSHMQDICIHDNTINFETRWSPNLQGLVQIANHFDLDFVSYYDEMSNGIFGEASYIKGTLLDVCLDPEDFCACENETAMLKKMLDTKKSANPYFKTASHISKEELHQLYGEMTEADFVLKFAEHKKFKEAREVFQTMDNDTIAEIDKYIDDTRDYGRERFGTDDKYIAMAFLKLLVNEWNQQRPPSFGLHR